MGPSWNASSIRPFNILLVFASKLSCLLFRRTDFAFCSGDGASLRPNLRSNLRRGKMAMKEMPDGL
jgi:hypothetical protein